MGRVFFPTYSLNRFGVRDLDQRATLGADVSRYPAEPTPRAAMTPTGPILGAIAPISDAIRIYPYPPMPGPMPVWPGPLPQPPIFDYWGGYPIIRPITTGPITSSGGGGATPTPQPPLPVAAPPVSSQVLPTPTVTLPPPPSTSLNLISSGGGTETPSTPTIVSPAPSGGFVEGIAAWLAGSTTLFNYRVPNAVIAGVVILGFAWLSSSDSRRKR